jgi:hypothetical protein
VEQVFPGTRGGKGKVAQTMYTNVSRYKNDKIRGEKKKSGWGRGVLIAHPLCTTEADPKGSPHWVMVFRDHVTHLVKL